MVAFIRSILPLYADHSNIHIEFQTRLEKVMVRADKDQILRVLNNLVNNAVQAISDADNGKILLSLTEEGRHIKVSVQDNGVGIQDEMKAKIFQPNFSTKSYGTGLGLAMCKRIIEQHGGHIGFDSERGKGTTFYFTLDMNG
jgi:signal transduction histidine kinase